MWASASAENIPMVVERFGFGWPKRTSGLAPSLGAAQVRDDAVGIIAAVRRSYPTLDSIH